MVWRLGDKSTTFIALVPIIDRQSVVLLSTRNQNINHQSGLCEQKIENEG
jgi:hypothetical protein